MNPQPTLQTLPIDCLIEISSYLSLPECIFLRSSSRQLKAAVDEHFRTGVRTLPVVLSARYSPESVALYDEYCQQDCKYYDEQYEKFAYGSTSGVSQLEMYEDKPEHKFESYETHFRSENFLILFDLAKFGGFVDFITKYLPGITKLALIIDHEDHMNHVPTILNFYQKQLKVLFVERTARSLIVLKYNLRVSERRPMKILRKQSWQAGFKEIDFSPEFYQSIDDLEVLGELHFFPKKNNLPHYSEDGMLEMRNFLKRMLQKLKVLHFQDCLDIDHRLDTEFYQSAVFENLEKLIWNGDTMKMWLKASFPRLETLIIVDGLIGSINELMPENMPSLRTFCIGDEISIGDEEMETFNKLPKLERIHCQEVFRFGDPTTVNRSVKFIEIELLHDADSTYSDEEELKGLKECLRCFQGLEKVIIREPFMELTGSDLQQE